MTTFVSAPSRRQIVMQRELADLRELGLPVRDLARVDVVQLRKFGQDLSPADAVNATFALMAAAWLRRDCRFIECVESRLPAGIRGGFSTDQPV